ncbi:MAG: hypothetical protein B6I31_05450, partial [Desulfobacteraceae bacterium 4572_19]
MKIKNLDNLEGTIAYISPEQTGRMNRSLDYRTDFYSLGVTLYEILTGKLPFAEKNLMTVIHNHIAASPVSPVKRKNISWVTENEKRVFYYLSDIILKLMSKSAEDRYQSVFGLKHDFLLCLDLVQLKECKKNQGFKPGEKDISMYFKIPQKLYGREIELEFILDKFKRVCLGKKEFVLVAGYSGVGKSALVMEIYKSAAEKRGYFIQGKFDQFQRDIPYSAFTYAFAGLVKYILSETEDRIASWRERLCKALGYNGQIIIDLVPEMELLIGKQPELSKLGLDEVRNRFNTTVQDFIRALGGEEYSIVIFLDDLQWADS